MSEIKIEQGRNIRSEESRARKSQKKKVLYISILLPKEIAGGGKKKKKIRISIEDYPILKVQENKFHIKMNNRRLLYQIPHKITVRKKTIVHSLKTMKTYFKDVLKKQIIMSKNQMML